MSTIPTLGFVSLGCAKNLVDTERLTSALVALGYNIDADYSRCDAVIVNTCGFIDPAVEESLEAIGEALDNTKKVIVTGCLGAKAELIKQRYPKVSEVYGPGMRASVIRGIIKHLGQPPQSARQKVDPSGVILTPSHYAYLKVAEGCRHRCTFCIIPTLRGPLRSREESAILKEASDLVRRGVKELLVIAQDSSDYGFDLKNKSSISTLCRKLSKLGRWLRVHYVDPAPEADRLVALMGEGLVLPYLDVPLQHISTPVLKNMKRPGSLEKTIKVIEHWRSLCPDLAIRSTFITGFPGETSTQFEELLGFIKEAKLDRVGCFPYSNVEGAAANELPGSVDPQIREERAQCLMELQSEISYAKLEKRVGTTCQVLIDYVSEEGTAVGRSKYEAPDVDGVITLENVRGVRTGDFVQARIIAHDEHDMTAQMVEKSNAAIRFAGV